MPADQAARLGNLIEWRIEDARVVHFDIGADDPERAIRFYSDVFGGGREMAGAF